MVDIIIAKAAFDAEAVVVGGAVAAIDHQDLIVFDMHFGLAADAAIGAQRVDGTVGIFGALAHFVHEGFFDQRAGWASLDALAAGHAGALTHWVIEIEDDFGAGPAVGHADHIIDLDFAAGAHAKVAVDAGIEIDRHSDVAEILVDARFGGKAGCLDLHLIGPIPKFAVWVRRGIARRLICCQQLQHHFLGFLRPVIGAVDFHARRRFAHA